MTPPKLTLKRVLASFDAGNLPFDVATSSIHGKGAFANRPIQPGAFFVEYLGPRLTSKEAAQVLARTSGKPNYMFGVTGGIIDGTGFPASFLNHSCEPNVQAIELKGRVFFQAIALIKRGEELLLDYSFDPVSKRERFREYRCHCGAPTCRKTMAKVDA